MNPSEACYTLIKRFEGCRLDAYPDPATGGDPWTVGWGHTGPEVKKGYSILQQIADAYLVKDVQDFADEVNEMLEDRKVTQGQFDALVSFCYNLGPTNLRKSTLLRKLRDGDVRGAASQFMSWTHAAGKQLPGLVKRRAAEEQLFLS